MRTYRPSNQIPSPSLILMLIVTIIAGVALGGILWALEHFANIYLVVAFPIFAGAIAGWALSLVVRNGKVRNPTVVMIFGLLAGLLIYGTYHVASYYVSFRGEVRDAIVEDVGQPISDQELDQFINEVLQEEVGDTGIMGYMRLNAREGFTVTRTSASSSSSGFEIKNEIAWIYWGIEILIAAGMAIALSRKAANEPFDENTGEWYQAPVLIGLSPAKSRKALVNALKAGDYHEAGCLLTGADTPFPRLELVTRRSPDPMAQDVMMMVNLVQRKNRVNEIQRGMVTPSEIDMMLRAAASGSVSAQREL